MALGWGNNAWGDNGWGGTLALTGVVGTGLVGTEVPTITIALTGVGASGAVGTVVASTAENEDGTFASGFVGTIAPTISKAITGVVASGAVGTVTTGTALKTQGAVINTAATPASGRSGIQVSYGILSGSIVNLLAPGIAAVSYSTSSPIIAGGGGYGDVAGNGGMGGLAIAISPVSGPVAITVGAGGAANPGGASLTSGGIGGAVVVEFVG